VIEKLIVSVSIPMDVVLQNRVIPASIRDGRINKISLQWEW
jgi:hypothetical protein